MLIGKATLVCLGVLPMTIVMMYVVPKNIEASCFAIITGILTFSTDCAGDIVGAFFCDAFGITVKDMTNYHKVVVLKMILILICMPLIQILPSNAEIYLLGEKLNILETPKRRDSEEENIVDSHRSFADELRDALNTEEEE